MNYSEFIDTLKKEKNVIVLLKGEMGAGKTTFVCRAVKELIASAHPSSPTFNIINQYSERVFHADLYRIKDENELENIGFREILNGGNIVFVEWYEKAPIMLSHLKSKIIHVTIEVINENGRKISFN